MLAYQLVRVARLLLRLPQTAWIVLFVARSKIGLRAMLYLFAHVPDEIRPYCIKAAQKIREDESAWADIIAGARRTWEKRQTVQYLEVLALCLIGAQKFPEALAVFEDAGAEMTSSSVTLRNALTICQIEVGDFTAAVAAAKLAFHKNQAAARAGSDCLYGAFAAGHLRDYEGALEFFAAHFQLIDPPFAPRSKKRMEEIRHKIARKVLQETLRETMPDLVSGRKIGIFFLSSTQALGHAILDPYHFLALTRGKYDQIFFIGPPRMHYNAAPAVCLDIVEQYGEYIETNDDLLINLSWMNLGNFSSGDVDFYIANYWALLRESTLSSGVRSDGFQHNAWHMTLPPTVKDAGEAFCKTAGIDLEKPLIVLHARDLGYHHIVKQSYRDVDVTSYRLAIEKLLDRGYQVVRIGDKSMKQMKFDGRAYYELPFLSGYHPRLDPFLIWRSQFMIGCQSGPCAYARAFGKPLLSINAVYHYTLLPTPREQAAFKHYMVRQDDGALRELSAAEALERNVFWLENSHQFDKAGIELHPLSPEEIADAVESMILWVTQDTPKSEGQKAFTRLVRQASERVRTSPAVPVADFLGFSLPGYRITPTQGARLMSGPAPFGSETISIAASQRN